MICGLAIPNYTISWALVLYNWSHSADTPEQTSVPAMLTNIDVLMKPAFGLIEDIYADIFNIAGWWSKATSVNYTNKDIPVL